jgi:polysaccharide biosynthesis protein PslJ
MTLRVFLAAVKRHWKAFAITAGVVFAVGLISLVLMPAKYVSTTRLMVSVEGSTTAAAYQNDGVVTGRINTYLALLTTDAVTQRVIDKLKLPESPHELAEQVNATNVPPRTSLIDIAVTDESAERARLIAQTLADEFIKFADATETPTGEDSQKVHTIVVTPATAPQQQVMERVALGGLAALVALILGAAAVWIRSARDPVLEMAGPDAASDVAPPVKTIAAAPPETVQNTDPVPRTRTPADEPPAKTSRSVPPRTIGVVAGLRLLQARLLATIDRARKTGALHRQPRSGQQHGDASAGRPPINTTPSARPRTIDVLEGYHHLQARLRARTARWRRTGGLRIVVRRQQPDAAPTTGNREPLPRAHLATAESRERTPWVLGFLCLLIPILPSYVVPAGPLKSNGSPALLIALMLFGLAVLGFVLIRRATPMRTVQPGLAIIVVYFLLQLLVYGVGTMHTGTPIVEASKTRALINLVANVGVALYLLLRIRTTRQRNFLLGCLATGLAFTCLAGLLQGWTQIDLRFFFQPPGFVVNTEDFEFSIRSGVKRVAGTSLHPIEFSILAAVTVPLAIYFCRNAKNRSVRFAAVLLCGLALVSMPGAVSRTGVIALAVALFVYMWNFTVRQIAAAVAVGSTLIIGYFVYAAGVALALWDSITGAREDDSIQARVADYTEVSQTFRAHPLFGLGLGASPPSEYGLLDNEWLQAIVQGGVVGVTAMMLLVVGGMFGFNAALRRAKTPGERDQAYMLGSIFFAIMVCSFFFDLLSFQQAARILFIAFGLLWSSFTVALPRDSGGHAPPLAVDDFRPIKAVTAAVR